MHQHVSSPARHVACSALLVAFAASFVLAARPAGAGELTLPADALDRLAARAAATAPPEPYIRIHEADGSFRAVVMGDSMADGMYSGLYRVMKDEAKLEFVKKTKVNTGIVRSDRYDWNEAARTIAGEKKYDIAVLVFGANDLQSIREGGKAYHFRQPGWEERFSRRIDDIIASLKGENIATYWVGLPITRKDRYQDDYAYVNGFFRAAAARNGIRYVETWEAFADENGEFSAFGTNLSGEKVQLRADDGVHFTPQGYEKYASVVAAVLRRDVAAASEKVARQETD